MERSTSVLREQLSLHAIITKDSAIGVQHRLDIIKSRKRAIVHTGFRSTAGAKILHLLADHSLECFCNTAEAQASQKMIHMLRE